MTDDDRKRLNEIAGELEHLPASIKRNFDQDGRDARFLRILAEQSTEQRSEQAVRKQVIAEVEGALTKAETERDEQARDGEFYRRKLDCVEAWLLTDDAREIAARAFRDRPNGALPWKELGLESRRIEKDCMGFALRALRKSIATLKGGTDV